MRHIRIIAVFLAFALSLSSCDYVRKILSKPTSNDIAEKKALIEKEKLSEKKLKDSLSLVEQRIADSLALQESIQASSAKIVEAKNISEETLQNLKAKFYIVVGTFSVPENAAKYVLSVKEKGYEAYSIKYYNGQTAVCVKPSDKLEQAENDMEYIRATFCPGAWILFNNK